MIAWGFFCSIPFHYIKKDILTNHYICCFILGILHCVIKARECGLYAKNYLQCYVTCYHESESELSKSLRLELSGCLSKALYVLQNHMEFPHEWVFWFVSVKECQTERWNEGVCVLSNDSTPSIHLFFQTPAGIVCTHYFTIVGCRWPRTWRINFYEWKYHKYRLYCESFLFIYHEKTQDEYLISFLSHSLLLQNITGGDRTIPVTWLHAKKSHQFWHMDWTNLSSSTKNPSQFNSI